MSEQRDNLNLKSKNPYLTYGFLAVWMFTAGHAILLKYLEGQHTAYWSTKETEAALLTPNRSPSALLDFDPDSLEVYRDFFDFEDFQKYLDYRLSIKVFSDKPEEFKPKIDYSLKEAINQTLMQAKGSNSREGIESHDKGLMSLIEGKLFSDLVFNFRRNLKNLKIEKGRYQVNFNFLPRISPEFSYREEFSSNQLIDWSTKGSLVSQLNQNAPSFEEKIITSPVPSGSDVYQYKGGQISLWFDLKDSPKGFVRIRRYFRATELANSKAQIEDEQFRVNLVHFKSLNKVNRNGLKENFITVDLYKKFESEGSKPELDRVELHFGKVLPEKFHNKDLARSLASYSSTVIETSELNIHGVLNFHDKEYMFVSKVEKLVFDFKTGEFSSKSKLNTIFQKSDLKGTHLGSAQFKVSQKLLDQYGIRLIESFKLGEIHSKFGGKKK